MQIFKDNSGRSWTLSLTVAAIKRVRAMTTANGDPIDLAQLGDDPSIAARMVDPMTVCDVVWCLVKPQADAENITDEQFGEGLTGTAIADAVRALLGELSDFFQTIGRTDAVQILSTTLKVAEEMIATNVRSMVKIESNLLTSGTSSTSSPESSESTPTPSPSDRSTACPAPNDPTSGTEPPSSPDSSTTTPRDADAA
jgi:hypothetical protein